MTSPKLFVGLDVGCTNLKVLAFTPSGESLAEEVSPTMDDGSGRWLDRARVMIHRILNRCAGPARVGIAAPGLPARDGRSITTMPGRLSGIEGLNWRKWLELDSPVPVYNDAQAALLGETWIGAAKGATNVLLLTLGTGVGGAAMVDGRVLRGHIGRAGHLGHISLDPDGAKDITNAPGSLEDAIGEHTLSVRSQGRFRNVRELISACDAGSEEAKEIWLRSVRALAAGCAGLINVLDPEAIVIGGGIAEAGDFLFTPLRAALDQFEWRPGGARVRIVRAALGQNAGATGAARAAQLAWESESNPAPSTAVA